METCPDCGSELAEGLCLLHPITLKCPDCACSQCEAENSL
jgi:hypothetical protein